MPPTTLRPWSTITREERFFTAILFHDIRQDPEPFWSLLRDSLDCSHNVAVIDTSFEVCFFRDGAYAKLIEPEPELIKQTFDLALWLSNRAMVIIEAKAQQSFHTAQMAMLQQARSIIQSSEIQSIERVYLVGVCSSRYVPKLTTRENFDDLLRWDRIAKIYPLNSEIYRRANEIYGK